MKNLKKFVALLLAGVMAMVLFTACSDGGNGSNLKEDKTAEDKILSKYSTGTVAVENDKALKAEAEKFLDEKLTASAGIGGYKFVFDSKVEGQNQKYLTVLVAAKLIYKDTLLGDFLTDISKRVNTGPNVDISQNGNWTDIGVVVKSDTKQSYVAIAFKVKNPNYHK